jgi:ankyrin repeat/IBR domain-containing protein 1
MFNGCKELVPELVVQKLVDEDDQKKYTTFLSKNFVEKSQEVRWCPQAGCGKVVYDPIVEADNYIGICSCGKKILLEVW